MNLLNEMRDILSELDFLAEEEPAVEPTPRRRDTVARLREFAANPARDQEDYGRLLDIRRNTNATPTEFNDMPFNEIKFHRGYDLVKWWHWLQEQDSIAHDVFICGGHVRWMASPQMSPAPAGDLDIYCINEESFEILRQKFRGAYLQQKMENDVSVSYRQPTTPNSPFFGLPELQLIKPLSEGSVITRGDLERILRNFDFSVIRVGMDLNLWNRGRILADPFFRQDEQDMRIRIQNIHCPISSAYRCIKYINKGYKLPSGQMLKLFMDWENRDQEYRDKIKNFFQRIDAGAQIPRAEFQAMYSMMRVD